MYTVLHAHTVVDFHTHKALTKTTNNNWKSGIVSSSPLYLAPDASVWRLLDEFHTFSA